MSSRTAAIRALLLQAPLLVVAGMLGYHVVGVEAIATRGRCHLGTLRAGDHLSLMRCLHGTEWLTHVYR